MRHLLLFLLMASTSAFAERNPFLQPDQRQTQPALSVQSPEGGAATVAPMVPEQSPKALKAAALEGAKMVAIINGEEVWYKPSEGFYVRYPATPHSKSEMEAQVKAPDVEAIEKGLADVQNTPKSPKQQAQKW